MITCRPATQRTLLQRNDIYEVCYNAHEKQRVWWKTSTEFEALFLQLQSASSQAVVPPLPVCRPNRFKIGGGKQFHMQRSLSYEYLLSWAHKHQLCIFHDFLHIRPPTTTTTSDITILAPRGPFPVSGIVFVLVCLVCIGLSANHDTAVVPHTKVIKPSTAVVDYTKIMFALQILCFATVQIILRVHTAPLVSTKDRFAILDFSLREQIVVVDEDEYETDEEEEGVVTLMRGELMVEEEVCIEPMMKEDSFVLKRGEVSFEYTTDDNDEWASQADAYFTDSEYSTELSSGNEEDEESSPRRRTNWNNVKDTSVCYDQSDNDENLFCLTDPTKAMIGVASVVLIAGVVLRMRRWTS